MTEAVNYRAQVPSAVHLTAAEPENGGVDTDGFDPVVYDPAVYLEADLFGQGPTPAGTVKPSLADLVSRGAR